MRHFYRLVCNIYRCSSATYSPDNGAPRTIIMWLCFNASTPPQMPMDQQSLCSSTTQKSVCSRSLQANRPLTFPFLSQYLSLALTASSEVSFGTFPIASTATFSSQGAHSCLPFVHTEALPPTDFVLHVAFYSAMLV